jgi:DNA-binding MarR family transcriptional regulator
MNVLEQKRDKQDLRINRTFVNEKGAALLSKVRRAWEVGRKS